MRACSSASGGVMFLPDEADETNVQSTKAVSYRDLVKEEESKTEAPKRLFGKKKATDQSDVKAA